MKYAERSNFSQHVTAEIRAEMGRQRKSATALAAELGMSVPAATRRVNGICDFSLDELESTCGWLGVPVTEMLSRAEGAA